jgi:hypothetical protein
MIGPRPPSLTPPWHTHQITDDLGNVTWQLTADDYVTSIASTATWPGPGTTAYEAGKAVSQLLAAAPELYHALRLARTFLAQYQADTERARWGDAPPPPRADWHLPTVLQEIDDALRRARGEGW